MSIHPGWIRTKRLEPEVFHKVDKAIKKNRINTVCRSARCPNVSECFSKGHMTFLILGDICTRGCRFCSVGSGVPTLVDKDEPERIADVIKDLEIKYVVITSVTRDDLPDKGAEIFSKTVSLIKDRFFGITVEILTPDFSGNNYAIESISPARPDIWAHNLEMVPRLYPVLRAKADYNRSLHMLEEIKLKTHDILTKSGIMLGLGEKKKEVLEVFRDLKNAEVDIVTIGQYLQPDKSCVEVDRYVDPKEFEEYRDIACNMGFKEVKSGPLVRSSYR